MKKAISILLAMGLAVSSLTGCSSEEPKTDTPAPESTADETEENTEGAAATEAADAVHLTLAHADTETGSLFGECMTEFKQKVEEASGGSIIIDIYPNGQLGTVAEYVAGIQNGSIDLAPGASTFVANFCTGVSVFAFSSAYGNRNGNDSFRTFTMKNTILNKLLIYKIFS